MRCVATYKLYNAVGVGDSAVVPGPLKEIVDTASTRTTSEPCPTPLFGPIPTNKLNPNDPSLGYEKSSCILRACIMLYLMKPGGTKEECPNDRTQQNQNDVLRAKQNHAKLANRFCQAARCCLRLVNPSSATIPPFPGQQSLVKAIHHFRGSSPCFDLLQFCCCWVDVGKQCSPSGELGSFAKVCGNSWLPQCIKASAEWCNEFLSFYCPGSISIYHVEKLLEVDLGLNEKHHCKARQHQNY